MFTGIIQHLGRVDSLVDAEGGGKRLWISDYGFDDPEPGESICVDGVCLTIAEFTQEAVAFDLGVETLQRSIAGNYVEGTPVNLERSLRVGDKMGGHFVSGHVDATGTMVQRRDQGEGCEMDFEAPAQLLAFVADKGSVGVCGVSLTPFKVSDKTFTVSLIPHTLKETTLGLLKVGDSVNLEIDMLARYVQRMMEAQKS